MGNSSLLPLHRRQPKSSPPFLKLGDTHTLLRRQDNWAALGIDHQAYAAALDGERVGFVGTDVLAIGLGDAI